MKNIVKAFIDVFKYAFIKKKFYKKLLAYGCIIGSMKYDLDKNIPSDKWKRTEVWEDELPSIYNLDEIVDKMNNHRNKLNELYKLDEDEWSRDDVRNLMQAFEQMHNGFSRVENRDFNLTESCLKLASFINIPFWRRFKYFYESYNNES